MTDKSGKEKHMQDPSFRKKRTSKSINVAELDHIEGPQLSDMKISELIKAYKHIGFQATQVGRACELIQKMSKDADIFLAHTSNIGSSGLREIIAQLVKHKKVAAIITTAGAIEEDLMKTMHPFLAGEFHADDNEVKENKLNRLGNIFVPDEYYGDLEDWDMPFIKELHAKKQMWTPSDIIREIGLKLTDEHSILYWAAKNDIPIFCPAIIDGAMGDHFFFFNQMRKDKILIETTGDLEKFHKMILAPKKIGGVILGGSLPKHHLIGAAILRDGLDYAIYVQTGTPGDGSLSGAHPTEAVSWNKLKDERNSVLVEAEATIVFPLIAYSWLEN